jgi:XTP/dITP diphosphohydrolase
MNYKESFEKLVTIMDELREKCPWDKKQTIQTLRTMTIEEAYELTDAITTEDWSDIKEELGDILLHVIFYARIATEQNKFTLNDVIETICNKLIIRHPHIYGDFKVNDEEDVKRNWEKVKLSEGKKSVLDGVPVSLPAVVKATRIQEKAKQVGFEWSNAADVWLKVEEEMRELQAEISENNNKHTEEEFGDLLFSLINYARFLNIDAENALEKTNKKFIHRFKRMESIAKEKNKNLHDMQLEEMDAIWNIVKKEKPLI